MNRNTLFTLVWLLGAVLSFAACGGEKSAEATDTAKASAKPEPAKETKAEPAAAKAPEPKPEEKPVAATPASDEKAPDKYTVKLDTTKGEILIDVTREWAPRGADRFYTLVKNGYYNNVAFFRVISGFMAQVGINGDPAQNTIWRERRIDDDPVKQSNTRGMVTFATSGPNSRTTQFFINFGDNANLDGMGFSPFGKVKDMAVMDKIYAGYGEGAPRGRGPSQGRLQGEGNPYLKAEFPELDYIKTASIAEGK